MGDRSDTFPSPDLTIFRRLDDLGIVVTGQSSGRQFGCAAD